MCASMCTYIPFLIWALIFTVIAIGLLIIAAVLVCLYAREEKKVRQ